MLFKFVRQSWFPNSRRFERFRNQTNRMHAYIISQAETWRRVWGDRKYFSRTKFSERPFLGKNFRFNAENFFFCLSLLSEIWYITLFSTKNLCFTHKNVFTSTFYLFFSHFVLSPASINITSPNIGGTDAWAVPTSNILGGTSPQSPLSLRP